MCFTPQQCYDWAQGHYWVDSDPAVCGCRGSGWYLSNVDTWHRCPAHYDGGPHPEDDIPEDWANGTTVFPGECDESPPWEAEDGPEF